MTCCTARQLYLHNMPKSPYWLYAKQTLEIHLFTNKLKMLS